MKKPIPYGRQSITEEDIAAVVEVLKSDFLTQGPAVQKFEEELAKFVGAPHAIAVANGTVALHVAAMALGVKPGDTVLVTPNTFVASANCIRYCGGEVEFVDIDPKTLCLDPIKLEQRLKEKPKGFYKGLVVVDFAGYPADLQKLRNIADKHGLWILEDACHALGAEFKNSEGKWSRVGSGSYADFSVFSFHPVKHVATGEGGMLTTANIKLAERARVLRSHGITRDRAQMSKDDGPWYYEMIELGINGRISDVLCALGTSQLKRIDKNLTRRREIAANYDKAFNGLPIELPNHADVHHAFHLYPVQVDERAKFFNFLRERQVYTQIHYVPVHQQPYYKGRYGSQSYAATDRYYSRTLSLPMFHGMTDEDQKQVITAVKDFFSA